VQYKMEERINKYLIFSHFQELFDKIKLTMVTVQMNRKHLVKKGVLHKPVAGYLE